jgi:hypothetical protein
MFGTFLAILFDKFFEYCACTPATIPAITTTFFTIFFALLIRASLRKQWPKSMLFEFWLNDRQPAVSSGVLTTAFRRNINILTLLYHFQKLLGLSPDQQLLSFDGREMVDGDASLADCGVVPGATIRVSRLLS